MKYLSLLLFVFAIVQNAISQEFPFNADVWDISARGSIIEGYEGEENALQLQAGIASLNDVSFQNGIIEFDIYLSKSRGFPGILFRMADNQNYEEFYLRPHQSGNPDAMQYTPVFNGMAAWQLYHDQGAAVQDGRVTWSVPAGKGYNTVYTYPVDRWFHVKLVMADRRMDIYFDHEDVPTLQVREMEMQPVPGGICLRATSSVHFANFSISKNDNPSLHPLPEYAAPEVENIIPQWQVSSPFNGSVLDDQYELKEEAIKSLTWQQLISDPSGLANLSKVTAIQDRTQNTVIAKANITSAEKQTKQLVFGYSDRVKVYCNGQLLYAGTNGFRTRDYRYLGTIGYFDAIYLPLKKGKNEIIFAVSENFGGWGVQARLHDMINISSVE